jgi:cell division septal protein FtsQ
MWFRKSTQNRRLRRHRVLDVKARSELVRATRLNVAARVLFALGGLTLAVLVIWHGGAWALDKAFLRNEAFAVRRVEIQTDGILLREQLLQWSGVRAGDNLLALDLGRIKRDLELAPLVRHVAIERVLPGTLRVRVSERQPLVQVYALQPVPGRGFETVVYFIDTEGCVLPPLDGQLTRQALHRGAELLPALTSVAPADLRVSQRVTSPQMIAALRFIQEFARSPMAGLVDLKFVDVGSPETLKVVTRQGNEITFAFGQMDRQLRRWRDVHDAAAGMGRVIATLDLSVTNNVPARWQEAVEQPARPARPEPENRSRRKNV